MIKNYYWAMAVMAAFVAGTIATATPVFAPPPGDDDDGEGGWKAAVAEQQALIDEQQAQIDELKANEILGFYSVFNNEASLGGFLSVFADCDEGDVTVGGGHFVNLLNQDLNGSLPLEDGWQTSWSGTVNGLLYGTHVVCADYDPLH
jgi:hypothetical protein